MNWTKKHSTWVDGCPKCEDGYPYPHHEGDEADRHRARMARLDREDPYWDAWWLKERA